MAIRTVSNQAQLDAAILAVRGGDTIRLSPGTYDKLAMDTGRTVHAHVKFSEKVTITSTNPDNPAVINQLHLRGATNVEFKDLTIDYLPNSNKDKKAAIIENTKNIKLDDVDFEGHLSNGYGDGLGLRLKKSEGFTLVNSKISNFYNGISIENSTDVTIDNNDIRKISHDAMIFSGVKHMRIEGNDFRDMNSRPSTLHQDMIQFFNGPNAPSSTNVVIRDNIFINAETTHTMYFGNAMARAGDMDAAYRNITIEDNYIRAAHIHGITVEHGIDLTIRNNTLIPNTDLGYNRMVNIPLINVSNSSRDVTINNNQAPGVPDEVHWSWNVYGNATGARYVKQWEGSGATLNSVWSAAQGATATTAMREDVTDTPLAGSFGEQPAAKATARVDGRLVKDETWFHVEDLDLSKGEQFTFRHFQPDTFDAHDGGNMVKIWKNGGAAIINSIADIHELVAFSPGITVETLEAGDSLVLRIEQDDGVAVIAIEGLGAEFDAAYHPDLF